MNTEKWVLIGVVKSKKDLNLILKNRIYRIPVKWAPKRWAQYIAFYQSSGTKINKGLFKIKPAGFDGVIRWWAKIKGKTKLLRKQILKDEPAHPRAKEAYWLINLGLVKCLPSPITNKRRMRVTFGFITLEKLKTCREVKELFDVPALEERVEDMLKELGLPYQKELTIRVHAKKRYRLDFALNDKKIALAVECDGQKAHTRTLQKLKDAQKDFDLRQLG